MTNEELKAKLTGINSTLTFEEAQWLMVNAEAKDWLPLAKELRENPELNFDYMFCLTCVDWKTHMTMVYHLNSKNHKHTLVVKAKVDRNNPEIETVSHIWRTAEFHEREVFDLFGVKFLHHPDLRRLLLTDEWVGWPLRKDYEDAVNMIKL
jgi:NADH:ubiquinone oxidoreductase subunit C